MELQLYIIPSTLLKNYCAMVVDGGEQAFAALHDSQLSADTFSFYTSVSVVYSSKIEGEDIELDSYIKHKKFGAHFLPDHTQKIDDLYKAYIFTQNNALTEGNVMQAHAMLTAHILQESRQGKPRTSNMFVVTTDGKIEYVAASPEKIVTELGLFFADLKVLLQSDLTFAETLFFASMLHLVFVKIHPFEDGNGRISRLLEKWFLAQKLGNKAWFLPVERYYYEHHNEYYKNIRRLGLEYDELRYNEALPFTMRLVKALSENAVK